VCGIFYTLSFLISRTSVVSLTLASCTQIFSRREPSSPGSIELKASVTLARVCTKLCSCQDRVMPLAGKDKLDIVKRYSPRPKEAPNHCGHPYHTVKPYVTREKVGEWYCRVRSDHPAGCWPSLLFASAQTAHGRVQNYPKKPRPRFGLNSCQPRSVKMSAQER
jgi:hypothetical protein